MQIRGNITQIKDALESLLTPFSERTDILCTVSLSFYINNEEYLLHLQNVFLDASLLCNNINSSNEAVLIKKTDYDNIRTARLPLSTLLSNALQPEPVYNDSQMTAEQDKTQLLCKRTKTCKKSERSKHQGTTENQTAILPQSLTQNTSNTDLFCIEDHTTNCTNPNRPAAFAIKQLSENYYLLFYRKSVYDLGIDTSFRRYLSQQPGTLVAYKYFCNIANLRLEFNKHHLQLRHNGRNELSHYQVVEILKTFNILKYL